MSPIANGYCIGFVWGAALMHANWSYTLSEGRCYGMPGGVTARQAEAIVVTFMEKHPERLHEPAVRLVGAAMAEAFPCEEEDGTDG